eukprot:2617821-Rhodomonas_salina.1
MKPESRRGNATQSCRLRMVAVVTVSLGGAEQSFQCVLVLECAQSEAIYLLKDLLTDVEYKELVEPGLCPNNDGLKSCAWASSSPNKREKYLLTFDTDIERMSMIVDRAVQGWTRVGKVGAMNQCLCCL